MINYKNWLLEYSDIIFVACGNKDELIDDLKRMGIRIVAIDYNRKYKNSPNYIIKDFIFDEIDFSTELVVNFNCEKTYYKFNYSGDVILIGDNKKLNGDCNSVSSCQQLIDQYEIDNVYEQLSHLNKHYVWGHKK